MEHAGEIDLPRTMPISLHSLSCRSLALHKFRNGVRMCGAGGERRMHTKNRCICGDRCCRRIVSIQPPAHILNEKRDQQQNTIRQLYAPHNTLAHSSLTHTHTRTRIHDTYLCILYNSPLAIISFVCECPACACVCAASTFTTTDARQMNKQRKK